MVSLPQVHTECLLNKYLSGLKSSFQVLLWCMLTQMMTLWVQLNHKTCRFCVVLLKVFSPISLGGLLPAVRVLVLFTHPWCSYTVSFTYLVLSSGSFLRGNCIKSIRSKVVLIIQQPQEYIYYYITLTIMQCCSTTLWEAQYFTMYSLDKQGGLRTSLSLIMSKPMQLGQDNMKKRSSKQHQIYGEKNKP